MAFYLTRSTDNNCLFCCTKIVFPFHWIRFLLDSFSLAFRISLKVLFQYNRFSFLDSQLTIFFSSIKYIIKQHIEVKNEMNSSVNKLNSKNCCGATTTLNNQFAHCVFLYSFHSIYKVLRIVMFIYILIIQLLVFKFTIFVYNHIVVLNFIE